MDLPEHLRALYSATDNWKEDRNKIFKENRHSLCLFMRRDSYIANFIIDKVIRANSIVATLMKTI